MCIVVNVFLSAGRFQGYNSAPFMKPVRALIFVAPGWHLAPTGGSNDTQNEDPHRGSILNAYGVPNKMESHRSPGVAGGLQTLNAYGVPNKMESHKSPGVAGGYKH